MDPGLILSAASAIPQAGLGIAQAIKGKKTLESAVRPEYEIPEEIKKNLSVAERMALEGLPAEQKRQYVENLNKNMGAALSGFTGRKAGLQGLTSLVQSQNEAFKNLAVEDAMARQRNELSAMNQRETMAQYKDKAFELNKMQPYQEQVDEGQALVGSGIQNIAGSLNQLGGVGQFMLSSKMYNNRYQNQPQGGNPWAGNEGAMMGFNAYSQFGQ